MWVERRRRSHSLPPHLSPLTGETLPRLLYLSQMDPWVTVDLTHELERHHITALYSSSIDERTVAGKGV